MIKRCVFAAAAIFLFHLDAASALGGPTLGGPATGLWARAGDGGRGFNIDLQGNIMTVTTFVYTSNGAPIWYLSSGIYNHDTGRFQSSYDSYSNGQCFGCPANQPQVHSGAAGSMTIQFHNNVEATISTPAGSIQIKKFNYAFGSATDMLYGEWVANYNVAGVPGGDWLVFGEPFVDDGILYAAGNIDGVNDGIALGRYVPELNAVLIIATRRSSNFNHWYQLSIEDRRGFGASWVLPSSQTPTGNGSPAFMARLLWDPELVRGSAAPGDGDPQLEELDAKIAAKTACRGDCVPVAEFAGMLGAWERFKLEKSRQP